MYVQPNDRRQHHISSGTLTQVTVKLSTPPVAHTGRRCSCRLMVAAGSWVWSVTRRTAGSCRYARSWEHRAGILLRKRGGLRGTFWVREGNAMTTGKRESTTVVMHRGVLVQGQLSVEYYTSQPAPTQWIAVGLVPARIALGAGHQPAQMLVGSGQTEDVAVTELSIRLARLEAVAPSRPTDYSHACTVTTEPERLVCPSRPATTTHSYGAPATLVTTSSGRDW